jgi:hypothetical protein
MEKFPHLKKGQVSLIRADFNTGHILDDNFVIVNEPKQKVHTIFANTEEALNYARSIIVKTPSVECIIQGADEQMIHYITPKNIQNF